MKNLILTGIALILFFNFLSAQFCCIPEILLQEYERDVKHLALFRMESLNVPEANLIDIDESYQDTIWEQLAAIYHSPFNERDAVFDLYCIHHNIWTSFDYLRIATEIYVKIDSTASWYQNWMDESIITNDPFVDTLLIKYGFYDVNPPISSWGSFRLKTNQYLNLNAFADSLETHGDIILAEKVNYAGGNQKIEYQKINGDGYFNFITGWGDCPSGCIHWHTWSFKVDEFCDVTYLGSSGNNDLPDPYNCNLSDSILIVELNLPVDTFCIDKGPIQLTGGFPLGGNYNGPGISDNELTPFDAGVGNHIITYFYEGQGGCINSASQEITIIDEDCLTSTELINNREPIMVYPNPSNGNLTIDINNQNISAQLSLFNIHGKSIYENQFFTNQIKLIGVPKGTYILKVLMPQKTILKKLIVL